MRNPFAVRYNKLGRIHFPNFITKTNKLFFGTKNIKVEYKRNSWKILKLNEEFDLSVGFDDTFKADHHILPIILRENGMIGSVVRNIILKEGNVFF